MKDAVCEILGSICGLFFNLKPNPNSKLQNARLLSTTQANASRPGCLYAELMPELLEKSAARLLVSQTARHTAAAFPDAKNLLQTCLWRYGNQNSKCHCSFQEHHSGSGQSWPTLAQMGQ